MKKRFMALLLAGVLGVSALTGCGINKNETVATYGTEKVTLGFANFMCKYQQASMEDIYNMYFGEDAWNKDLSGSGSTIGDNVKSSTMDTIKEMYTLQAHMDDMGVSVTDDEKSKITEVAKAFMENNTSAALKEMGATQELVEEMLTLYTVKQKMYDAMIADVDTNVSDEEANMRAYSYIKVSTGGHYDESNNYVEYTDEEKAALKEKFTAFAAAITDPAMLETATEGQEDYTLSTGTYDADDTSLEEAVKTELDGLKVGEMSGVIETDSALYLVRVDNDTDQDATDKNRESIIAERKKTAYDDKLKEWQDGVEWNVKDKVLAKIEFKNHFTQKEDTQTEDTNTQEPSESADSTQN